MKATSDSKFILDTLKHGFKNLGAGIVLTDNEIKDIMKVIKSLKNKGIFLRETTKKLLVNKEDFKIFLDH